MRIGSGDVPEHADAQAAGAALSWLRARGCALTLEWANACGQ